MRIGVGGGVVSARAGTAALEGGMTVAIEALGALGWGFVAAMLVMLAVARLAAARALPDR